MKRALEKIVLVSSGLIVGAAVGVALTASTFLITQEKASLTNTAQIENVYFSPQDDCSSRLIGLINQAKESIFVEIYTFTDKDIADALISARKRGINVRVLFDKNQASIKPSLDEYLENSGISIKYDTGGIMHNKVMIIDGSIVGTGSFNYTLSANKRNNENIVIIRDKKTAKTYIEEFNRLWEYPKKR